MKNRKTILVLLLLSAVYAGWYYLQSRPRPPLRAELLPIAGENVDRITITARNQETFDLFREGRHWNAQRNNRNVKVVNDQPNVLLQQLLRLKSDGLVKTDRQQKEVVLVIQLNGDGVQESIEFLRTPDSLENTAFVRLNKVPDVFKVVDFDLTQLPLRFQQYRNLELLDLSVFNYLDSLVWQTDSLRSPLLVRADHESQLDSLYQIWRNLSSSNFAEEFDEIGQADRKFGNYLFFGHPRGDSIELTIYRDSLWVQPYVISSSQAPRLFWAFDSLPYPLPNLE